MIFSFPNLAAFFIFFCGCLFLYLAVREESREAPMPESCGAEPFRCSICAYIYMVEKGEEFSSCPRCGTINRPEDA